MTIDFAELTAVRERNKRFRATELGKLFYDYQDACIKYWQNDGNERCSDRKLAEFGAREAQTLSALVAKLMELANV